MEDLLTNPLIIAPIIGIISAIFGKKSKEEKQNSQKRKKPQHVQSASPQKKHSKEDAPAPIPNRMEQARREAEERRRETARNLKGLERDLVTLNKKQYTQNKKCFR